MANDDAEPVTGTHIVAVIVPSADDLEAFANSPIGDMMDPASPLYFIKTYIRSIPPYSMLIMPSDWGRRH